MIQVGAYEVTTFRSGVSVWRPGFGIVLRGTWNGTRVVEFDVFEAVSEKDLDAIDSALSMRDSSVPIVGRPT